MRALLTLAAVLLPSLAIIALSPAPPTYHRLPDLVPHCRYFPTYC
jgi:hypothetical protein